MAKRGINKAIVLGNLGSDPEIRYSASGDAIANFSVATSEHWNDKKTNEKVEATEWHKIVAFKKLAEIIGEYLKKGSKVYIEGKMQTRKWTDKDNIDRWTTEIVAHDMQMLDKNPNATGQRAPTPPHNAPANAQTAPTENRNVGDFDDDIPF
tara:strand:+ start:3056 stop:3511 length:456 start_codon:yes stop_codon:yes gene_type:complete